MQIDGNPTAHMAAADVSASELTTLLYQELRRAARNIRAGTRTGGTLQTTALIHEAYLKLARSMQWQSRGHFLASAALAMRQVLVDAARARMTQRRGDGIGKLSLDDPAVERLAEAGQPDAQVVAIGDALSRLAGLSPRLAQVVECRYYAGYTEEETAVALGITDRTVRRDWVKARAWLFQELGGDVPDASSH